MSYFAKIEDDIVTQVIVAEQEFIDTIDGEWIETSIDTMEGVNHLGGEPLRKNYAGPGFFYSREMDAFVMPTPYPSWELNEFKCVYEPPVPYPTGDYLTHKWDEELKNWVINPQE